MAYLVKLLFCLCFVSYFGEILTCLITSIEVDEPYLEGGIKGVVKDSQGFNCNYYEQRKPGKGPRTLWLDCSNSCGKKISCGYRGQPHDCTWYNKGNQPTFYKMMAEKLAKETNGICSSDEIEINKCPGIVFKKQ